MRGLTQIHERGTSAVVVQDTRCEGQSRGGRLTFYLLSLFSVA